MAEKFRTKKSLGQHFLKSVAALEKMAEAGSVSKKDTVVEIGPGEGVLTRVLLARGAHVIAIEKDDRLIPILLKTFRNEVMSGQLTLLHDDALNFQPKDWKLATGGFKLIANIPYYITGLILRHFLENDVQPSCAVLLVQKEVALRAVARTGRESLLSISIKIFGTPRYVVTVPRGAFSPPPKVDSAIIAIENIQPLHKREHFFTILRAGFAHPRKLLIKNLESVADSEKLAAVWEKIGVLKNARPENLSPHLWQTLTEALFD